MPFISAADEDDGEDSESGQLDHVMEDEEDENSGEEDGDLSDDGGSQLSSLVLRMKGADLRVPKETDFCKLTEGMDDLEESRDEEEGETGTEGESDEDEKDSDDGGDDDKDDRGGVMTFSKEKVDEEVEKGKAVRNQLGMWLSG